MINIGHDYIDTRTGAVVHCQDVDRIDQSALVGKVEEFNLVPNTYWIEFGLLKPIPKVVAQKK